MAIAASYIVQSGATIGTSAVQLYTVPTAYTRDLIITNSGALTAFVGLSASGTVATSVASFQVPSGGSVVLTQCQVPAGAVVSALVGSGSTGAISIGLGSVVSVI